MLRWLTAGESHGPALMATLEGLPAGVEVTSADVAAALARRRLGFGRGARMKFELDEVEFLGGLRHGVTLGSPARHPDRQHRVAQVADRDEPRPGGRRRARGRGRRGRAAGGGPQPAADPAAARPRRPGGHAEVRLRGRPARCSSGPRPARPPRAWPSAASRRPSWSRPTASGWSRTPWRSAPRGWPTTRCCRPRTTWTRSTPTRCAPWTPPGSAAMVAEVEAARKDGDTLGGVVEVVAYGLPPGLGLARALGPPARRPARRGADGDPGDQGRRGRRRVPHRRPARARRRTTRWSATPPA